MQFNHFFQYQIFLLFFPFFALAEIQENNVTTTRAVNLNVQTNILMKNSDDKNIGNIVKNGVRFIHNFGSNNTFVGLFAGRFDSLGSNNSGFGAEALRRITSGSNNTAAGALSLTSNRRGADNVAIGSLALQLNTQGSGNTAIGGGALALNTTGSDNIAIGHTALFNNVTGTDNIAIGRLSLHDAKASIGNIAIGIRALQSLTQGSFNVAIGTDALGVTQSADNNTAIGDRAGKSVGSNNIVIGVDAGSQVNGGNNNIMIGNVGEGNDNLTIRIGSDQKKTFISGIAGTSISGGSPVYIATTGQLGIKPSSKKHKYNICLIDEKDSQSIYDLNNDDKVFSEEALPILLLNEIKQLKKAIEDLPQLEQLIFALQEEADQLIPS